MQRVSQNSDTSDSEYDESGSDSMDDEDPHSRHFYRIDDVAVEKWDKKLEGLREEHSQKQLELKWLKGKREKAEEKKLLLKKEIEETNEILLEVHKPAAFKFRVEKKRKDVLTKEILEVEQELSELDNGWDLKQSEFESKLAIKRFQLETLDNTNRNLRQSMVQEVPSPGPQCLSWIDGDAWTIFSSFVIILNIWIMIYTAMEPESEKHAGWLNLAFLIFYIIELVLKGIYKQQYLVCGQIYVVWPNWLDVVIVVSGVAELIVTGGGGGGGATTQWLGYLRVLRLFRLARVAKIVVLLLTKDLSWARGQRFQSFIMGVIAFNCILLGLEVEFKNNPLWPILENVLLVIYTFELLVRIRCDGCSFFYNKRELFWNYLDLIIVIGAIIDQWIRPMTMIIAEKAGADSTNTFGNTGELLRILRLMRLIRILRLVKLIRGIKPLYTLAVGIAKSMQGMGWVMGLSTSLLYLVSLLAVKLAGGQRPILISQHADQDGNMVTPEKFRELISCFGNLPDAIYNLFKVMNADTSGVDNLVFYEPWVKWTIMCFTIVSNWAIFSILTAVVSENMAQVTTEHEKELLAESEEFKRQQIRIKLTKMFDHLDIDKSDTMTKDEFLNIWEDESRAQEFEELTGRTIADAHEIFEALSTIEDGPSKVLSIERHAFIEGLNREGDPLTIRSIMGLEKRLAGLDLQLREKLGKQTFQQPRQR